MGQHRIEQRFVADGGVAQAQHLMRPADLPTWGQRSSLRLLNLIGWKLPLQPPPARPARHRRGLSAHLELGLLHRPAGKWALGLQFRWLAKDSLFRGPMGAIMRYWGGVPVDRRAPMGATRAGRAHAVRWCWVAITPEGTRSYRPHWKSGFYPRVEQALLADEGDDGVPRLRRCAGW
jgi:hypothetical protein